MKHTIKHNSDTAVLLTVTLDGADLAPIQQKVLVRLARDVKVAGFRPGKVPPQVAQKHIDPNQLQAVLLEEAVNTSAIDAFQAEKLTALDRPKVDVKKYVPGQELEYTAEVEILPNIRLGDYKNLKAKKQVVAVTDADVNEVIERLRLSIAEKTEVNRASKNGDEIVIDFKGTDKDGREVPGASGNDYPLALGSNTFIPGFEEGLIGKKAGDAATLALTFPKDYNHKPLAGAKVTFAVTVKTVKEVTLPKADDAFAAKAGPFKKLDDLKTDIKRELTDQKEREALDHLKDALIGQLVKGSHIPTPEVLITDQMASIERDFVQNLTYQGMTLDQHLQSIQKSKDAWRKSELRNQAIRRVQVGLALAELSKVEDIQVSRDELDQRLSVMLEGRGNTPEIAKQLDTPEARRDIANRVVTEKTVARLVKLNEK